MAPVEKQLRGRREVSLSAFALMFAELVRYCSKRSMGNVVELEQMLHTAGVDAGERHLEHLALLERGNKVPCATVESALQFVHTNVWKSLFGKAADALEVVDAQRYIIADHGLITNRFVSTPKEGNGSNVGAFAAGVAQGVLESLLGHSVEATAYYASLDADDAASADGESPTTASSNTQKQSSLPRTNILICFSSSTDAR